MRNRTWLTLMVAGVGVLALAAVGCKQTQPGGKEQGGAGTAAPGAKEHGGKEHGGTSVPGN